MNPDPKNPPSSDQVMSLLGSVMETYSFRDFTPILRNPDRLKAWLLEEMPKQEDEREDVADLEQKTMELMAELKTEDRARLKAAFLELWGKPAAAMLPGLN